MLAMFHPWQDLTLGGLVALQLVGDAQGSGGSNSKRTESNELRKTMKEKRFLLSLFVRLKNPRF